MVGPDDDEGIDIDDVMMQEIRESNPDIYERGDDS